MSRKQAKIEPLSTKGGNQFRNSSQKGFEMGLVFQKRLLKKTLKTGTDKLIYPI